MKYSLIFLLVLGPIFFSGCSEEVVEMEEMEEIVIIPFSFEGKWKGSWSDSLFGSVPVTAEIRKSSNNSYSGSMYISSNYTPTYGGSTDGTIRFKTDGENKVTEFTYNQIAPDYKGGCPGEYEGTGEIDLEKNQLVIDFTGTDCDGFHDTARFIFRSE